MSRGVLQRGPDNRFDIDASRQSYLKHLRAQAHNGNEPLMAARVRLIELRAAKLRNSMMPTAAVNAFVAEQIGEFVVGVEGMIAREAKGRDERRRWRAAFNDVRNVWAAAMDAKADALDKDDAAYELRPRL